MKTFIATLIVGGSILLASPATPQTSGNFNPAAHLDVSQVVQP